MSAPDLSRLPRLSPIAVAVLAALTLAPSPSRAQVFAVGAGGMVSNDAGASGPSNFSKGGGFLFGEMRLESYTVLQLRVGRFGLPGKEEGSPDIRVEEASITVAYMFKEDWFEAGFYGGGGIYRVRPDDPAPGQVVSDIRENVWGLRGGVQTIFNVWRKLDLRLEGGVVWIDSTYSRSPIVLGAALSYRF